VGEIRGGWVQNALATLAVTPAESTECNPHREAQVVGGRLGVVLRLVGRQRGSLGVINGFLCPGLGVAPGGGPWALEFYGGLAVSFMFGKRELHRSKNRFGAFYRKKRQSVYVTDFKSYPGIERLQNESSPACI
jgi:hypothetical protein